MSFNVISLMRQKMKGKYYVSLNQVVTAAKSMVNRQLSIKRYRFDDLRLARIACVLVARRLQPTATTAFASQVDVIIQSLGGVILPALNKLMSALPLNMAGTSKGERFTCELTEFDMNKVQDWVDSGQFSKDLEELRSFAAAHNIGLVQINFTQTPVLPANTLRISNALEGKGTMPKALLISKIIKVAKVLQNSFKDEEFEAHEIEHYEGRLVVGKDWTPEQEKVFRAKHPSVTLHYEDITVSEGIDFTEDDCAYHCTKKEDSHASTINEASSFVFPMFQYVKTVTSSDEADIHFGTTQVKQFIDISDWLLYITAAIEFSMQIEKDIPQDRKLDRVSHPKVEPEYVDQHGQVPGGLDYRNRQRTPDVPLYPEERREFAGEQGKENPRRAIWQNKGRDSYPAPRKEGGNRKGRTSPRAFSDRRPFNKSFVYNISKIYEYLVSNKFIN